MMSTDRHSMPGARGLVLHAAAGYDFLAWVLLRGREREFRDRLVRLARVEPGEAVLDIGCGTGSLAIAAKRRVGPSGLVHGIDASPEMIVRARKKASRAGMEVTFTLAAAEALPFPDGSVDVVLSTLMLHHLPRPTREQCAREVRRVLKPGGRVLAVDFGKPAGRPRSFIDHLHRHGGVDLGAIRELLQQAQFEIIESGAVGVQDLNFVLARVG